MSEQAPTHPFSHPRFILSAGIVAIIAVLAIAVSLANARSDGAQGPTTAPAPPAPVAGAQPPPTAPQDEPGGGTSICGLADPAPREERPTEPPAVDAWDYQGTTAYPVSAQLGPAAIDPAGFRYCFQHSPDGAVMAAANAAVQGSGASSRPWLEYFLSMRAPDRRRLIEESGSRPDQEVRMAIAGCRLLSYTGGTASVDIAVRGVGAGRTVYGSVVYELVWEAGDWRLSPPGPSSNPLRMTQIPDLTGYLPWEA